MCYLYIIHRGSSDPKKGYTGYTGQSILERLMSISFTFDHRGLEYLGIERTCNFLLPV